MDAATALPIPDEVQQGVAFLRTRLAGPILLQGQPHIALAETAETFNDSRWFWTDDNAKALELLVQPALWDADPGLGQGLLDFVLAMSPGGTIHRRAAPSQLQVHSADPKDFRLLTAFHCFTGDLSRGVLRQAGRFNDNRGRVAASHTGNLVEFRHRGQRHCIDVEDNIVDYGVIRTPEGATLFHESLIRCPTGLFRRRTRPVGRLRYEYLIADDDPCLRLRVTLTTDSDVTLSRIRITTATDGMSDCRHALTIGRDGAFRTIRTHPAGGLQRHGGRLDYLGFHEDGLPCFGHALHIRPLHPERITAVAATWETEDRLHWVICRYGADRLSPGESISIEEQRLLTCGGWLGQVPEVAARMATPGAFLGVDPSASYDHGAELNAVATHYRFAAAGCYARPIPAAALAGLRDWFDRHVAAFFESQHPACHPDASSVFVRGLAFVLLALDTMARATGDSRHERQRAAALDLLLQAQQTGTDDGVFIDTGAGGAFLDSHAAALLALARLVRPGCDGRIVPALRRGLAALRLGTVPVPLGDTLIPFDTIVVRHTAPGGELREDGAFWTFKAALLLRALQAIRAAQASGALPLSGWERDRLAAMVDACERRLAISRRQRTDGTEHLTSPFSGETNSETQPWVLLAMAAVDEAVNRLPDTARTVSAAFGKAGTPP